MAAALPGKSHCTWPPQIVSRTRDLDLTQCFERALLLPVPLVFTILVGTVQTFSISRRLKRGPANGGVAWATRSDAQERGCKIKLVRTHLLRKATLLFG